jgi:DNA-binding ferritin-like protein
MEKIAFVLRYLQLYAHQAHNLVKGPTFFQDHEFLGELYPVYEDAYDSIIERSIGLGKPVNIQKVNLAAAKELPNDASVKMTQCFKDLLESEKYLCKLIEQNVQGASQGTMNLLADMADKSEVRQYKIQQRISQ